MPAGYHSNSKFLRVNTLNIIFRYNIYGCTSAIELSFDSDSHRNSCLYAFLDTDDNLFATLRYFPVPTSMVVL